MTELEKLFNGTHITDNGDNAYHSTGNKLLDILFSGELLNEHPELVDLEYSEKNKLFAQFIRDPRHGIGYRDLGRRLLTTTGASAEEIVKAGRFDDLLYTGNHSHVRYLMDQAIAGNKLAKKWLPSPTGKNKKIAHAIAKEYGMTSNRNKAYREVRKTDVVETLINEHVKSPDGEVKYLRRDEINFEEVPSLALFRHYRTFENSPELSKRFSEYLSKVKSGEAKINTSVTTHYDLYRNSDRVDADLFFKELPEVNVNCIPILDTSASMMDNFDSYGKASAIALALAYGSTYERGKVVSFSNRPQLLDIFSGDVGKYYWTPFDANNKSEYSKMIGRMYTGDIYNTDFGAVMDLLSKLNHFPDYLVVLSDMEFDAGSQQSKKEAMEEISRKSPHTKIIWWNFHSANNSVPETDEYGNIFMSGYSPQLLQYLEAGFDGNKFLDKLLEVYSNKIND